MYSIPYAEKWTIIINKENDTWGSFKYDEKKDLLRFDVLLLGAMTINENSGAALAFFAWFVILLGILSIIRTFVSYFSTEFAVTNKRIIAKTGLFRRRSLEMLLSKVESIGVNQPIMGRSLDYGTIIVAGTGGTKERFSNIVAPMDFRKRINAQLAGPVV